MQIDSPLELELQVAANHQMWMLGIKLRSSGWTVSALNHRAISPAPDLGILNETRSFINTVDI